MPLSYPISFFYLILIIKRVVCLPTLNEELTERGTCNEDNLLRALQATSRTKDSYPFCSSYISVPPTTTVTVFTATYTDTETEVPYLTLHPVQYLPLPEASSVLTPISYNSKSPSPSTTSNIYSGNLYPHKRQPLTTKATTTSSLPSYVATYPPSRISSACSCLSVPAATTTTISDYQHTQVTVTCPFTEYAPTATYPAHCIGDALFNAPTVSSYSALQTLAPKPVASKSDCCLLCTETLNCVWWLFTFRIPGKPWEGGTCKFAYHTGVLPYVSDETPAVCPNGLVQGLFNGLMNLHGAQEDYTALNYEGYNAGPCGGAFSYHQSAQDSGRPVGGSQPGDCPNQ